MMCELEGGKPKYALMSADMFIYNGQEETIVVGNTGYWKVPSRYRDLLGKDLFKAIGGLRHVQA